MDTTTELIKELQRLVSSESYPEALERFRKDAGIIESYSNSRNRKDLLLIALRIFTGNHLVKEVETCLNLLGEEYPGIENDFDYVIPKIKGLLLKNDYAGCSNFITDCTKTRWADDQDHWLKFYAGMISFWKGDYFGSNRIFEECRGHALISGDEFLIASASYMMGYIAFQRCFFEIADIHLNRALECYQRCCKKWSQGHTYKMMAILAYRTGEYEKSEKLLKQAIKIFEETGYGKSAINSNIALGRVYIFRGQYEEAESILLDTRKKSLELGLKRETALSSEFLGELCCHHGRYEESLVYLKEAEKIACEIAPEGDVAVEVFRRLGDVYFSLGKIDEAEDSLSKAHRLCESLNDKYELGSVLRAYGMLAARKNDIDLAMSFFNEAVVTLKLIKESFELGRTLRISAEACESWILQNNPDKASRDELLHKARDNAAEAFHLFSSKNLAGRAEVCKDLVERLEAEIEQSDDKYKYHKIEFDEKWLVDGCIVTASDSMKRAISIVRKLAPGRMHILVTGETGTGKEIIARLLHKFSDRAKGPFVPVNCASIPDSVFESELFGYRKGAFTGASEDREGLFEKASGGTLFLDEITELTSRQQAKLLRAVQEQRIRRVGETKERPVDVRLVSASNVKIEVLVNSNALREDLYYRISGGTIELEPLRNRKKDIIPLFCWFLREQGGEFSFEDGAAELLVKYHWPGNIRELINLVGQLALLCGNRKVIRKRDLPLVIRNFAEWEPRDAGCVRATCDSTRNGTALAKSDEKDELRRRIEAALLKHNGNKTAIARELDIGRTTLYRKLQELKIG